MKKLFVVFTAIAFVGAFAISVSASEWDFYGSARVNTIYESHDDDHAGGANEMDITKTIGNDDGGTNMDIQSTSRVGAKVKVNDEIGGRFEYGTGVNLRLLYGTWDFDGGQLLIGQSYTPITQMYSKQVWQDDRGMFEWGTAYTGRKPMIQLKTGGLKVALIQPQPNASDADKPKGLPSTVEVGGDRFSLKGDDLEFALWLGADVDAYLPKLEVSYCMKTDLFFFDVNAGAQTYSIEIKNKELGLDFDENVTSYILGADFGMNFGIAGFVIKGHYATNGAEYGLISATASGGNLNLTTNDIDDNDTYAVQALLNVNPSDTLALQFGVGYSASELDVSGSKKDDSTCYYGQAELTVVPGLIIVPEVGYIDEMDDASGADQGSSFYAGAKWQINF